MNGALLLGIVTLVCIADVFIGLRMARLPRQSAQDGDPEIAKRRQTGRMMMMAAVVLWLIVAAICFGILPSHAITPISF